MMISGETTEFIESLLEEFGTSGLFYRLCPDQSLRGFWQTNLRKEGTDVVAHFVCMWTPEDIKGFSEFDPEETSFEEACEVMDKAQKVEARLEIFALEYIKDLNATRAAIAAGYSAKTAKQQGSRLLTNVDLQERIKELLAKKTSELNITVERVLGELARLAFANMADYTKAQADGSAYVDLSNLTREQWAAVQEIQTEEYVEGKDDNARDVRKVRFELCDKRGSLKLLGRYLKLFTDKQEISGNPDVPIVFRIGELAIGPDHGK